MFCPETSIMLVTGKYLTLLCLFYALCQKKMLKATVGVVVSVSLQATICFPPDKFSEKLH